MPDTPPSQDHPDPGGSAPSGPSAREVVERLGGLRALVDGAGPPLVFVAGHSVLEAAGHAHLGPWPAAAAALGAGLVLLLARPAPSRARRGPALVGLASLAGAVGLASLTGRAEDAFLPGIYVDAAYAVLLALTVLVRRPALGYLYGLVRDRGHSWRRDKRLRRLLSLATLGWSLVYAARWATTSLLHQREELALLALAKLGLGWPLTVLAALATLAAVRRAERVART